MAVQWSLFLAALASLLLCAATNHVFRRCRLRDLQIVSLNEELLPPDNIAANDTFGGENAPSSFVHHGSNLTAVWCARNGLLNFSEPSVFVTFTEPVLIVSFASGGYTFPRVPVITSFNPVRVGLMPNAATGLREYVNNFTMEYSVSADGDSFVEYTPEGQPTFLVSEETIDRLTPLDEPFIATRLRFSIHGIVSPADDDICWSMALYGCPATEAFITVAPPPATMATDTPSQTAEGDGCSSPSPQQAQGISQKKLLSIIIPVAIATLLIVIIVVVLGVVLCLKARGQSAKGHKVSYERQRSGNSSVKILDNTALYASPDIGSARLQEGDNLNTIRKVDNVLYEYNQVEGSTGVELNYDDVHRRSSMEDNTAYGEMAQRPQASPTSPPPTTPAPAIPTSPNECYDPAVRTSALTSSGNGYSYVGLVTSTPVPSPGPTGSAVPVNIYESVETTDIRFAGE